MDKQHIETLVKNPEISNQDDSMERNLRLLTVDSETTRVCKIMKYLHLSGERKRKKKDKYTEFVITLNCRSIAINNGCVKYYLDRIQERVTQKTRWPS